MVHLGTISLWGLLSILQAAKGDDQVRIAYTSPESLYTGTHYAVFRTSRTEQGTIRTARNSRLDTIIVYDRATNKELKRVVFQYAPDTNHATFWPTSGEGDDPAWVPTMSLKDNQLTLVSVTVQSGAAPGPDDVIPPYIFSYEHNPKINIDDLEGYGRFDPTWTGSYLSPQLGTAWRLKSMKLPTGARINYGYQQLNNGANGTDPFSVVYDPEGRLYSNIYNLAWSYKAQPHCRLASKTVQDSLPQGVLSSTWTYTYGDAVYDPPSRPSLTSYIPQAVLNVRFQYDPTLDFYKAFRGCTVGHRWVKVSNPDGSWKTSYYTSSYGDFSGLDKQPDEIFAAGKPLSWQTTIIKSRSATRGLIWRELTNLDTVDYTYDYTYRYGYVGAVEGTFWDLYDYGNPYGDSDTAHHYKIEQNCIWPRLTKIRTVHDGIVQVVLNDYNTSPRWDPSKNGLLVMRTDSVGEKQRRISYGYAYQTTPGMDTLGMRSQLGVVTTTDGFYTEDARISDWALSSGHWLPKAQKVWSRAEHWYTPQASEYVTELVFHSYDAYGNLTCSFDANKDTTYYYYGSNSDPFNNAAAGLSHGYVTGIRLPQWNPLLQRSFQYDQFGNVTRIKDENGDTIHVDYDKLGRVIRVIGPNAQKLR